MTHLMTKPLTISVMQEIAAGQAGWYYIVSDYTLSECIMQKYKDQLDWERVCIYQKLSEDFINKNLDKVDFLRICTYQILSGKFIKDNESKIYWLNIAYNQDLFSYGEEIQDLILSNIIGELGARGALRTTLTKYMLEQYNKYKTLM